MAPEESVSCPGPTLPPSVDLDLEKRSELGVACSSRIGLCIIESGGQIFGGVTYGGGHGKAVVGGAAGGGGGGPDGGLLADKPGGGSGGIHFGVGIGGAGGPCGVGLLWSNPPMCLTGGNFLMSSSVVSGGVHQNCTIHVCLISALRS